MAELIDRFTGVYHFLNNAYPLAVIWQDIEYPTAEHAYQAGKALDPYIRVSIASAPTSDIARHRGADVVLRPDWDRAVRYHVMREVLKAKFIQPYLRRLLLSTGEAELVNGNDYHDMHWGRCYCPRHRGFGVNQLGLLLEGQRQSLRQYA